MSKVILLVVLGLMIALPACADVKVEKIEYKGWRNCYRVSNGEVELIVTSDVGPRVIRFGFVGGQNVFKEFPDQLGGNRKIPAARWRSRLESSRGSGGDVGARQYAGRNNNYCKRSDCESSRGAADKPTESY
jgi:hypothetical protein